MPTRSHHPVRTRAQIRAIQAGYRRCIERGLHSGIPGCCIVFFLAEWLPLFDDPRAAHAGHLEGGWAKALRLRRAWQAVARKAGQPPPQYVPCRGCVRAGAASFRRIHTCTAACKGKPGECWT